MENEKDDFFELDKAIKEYGGNIFERLVEIMLKKLYPQYCFTRTEYSHDGGKDFYAVDGETNIWAEAKCHKRHLELGRIAGTFIMAELCKINRIIIFSSSNLTSGAIKNLTKFTSRNDKELIIFNDTDIRTLINSFGIIDDEEIIHSIGHFFDLDGEIVNLIKDKRLSVITQRLVQLKQEKMSHIDEDKNRYEKQLNLYLTLYAYLAFNNFAQSESSLVGASKDVKIINKQFYLQNDSANSEELKTSIRAFDVFSAELVIRNEDVLHSKNIKIQFKELSKNCKAVTPYSYDGELLPGQSIALTFFFKALNASCKLALPQPIVLFENEPVECKMSHNDISIIPCQIVGEIPYIGKDSNKLSQLNQDLESTLHFTSVLVYGKSGVGKSRFLYELHSECLKKGKRCFIFHGDNTNNSILDFIRQLLYGYYNISFIGQESEIVLPKFVEPTDDSQIQKYIDFLNTCLNCKDENLINLNLARNWLVDIVKTDNTILIIDNVQHLSKKVLTLLSKAVSDLKNCKCKSEIIFTFNTELTISDSPADNFFQHLKCNVKEKYDICLEGFDEVKAVDYLKYSLDPRSVRNDLEELYKSVAIRANNNPLFLKQLVLYLYQQNVIGFQNDTLCIMNYTRLIQELNSLPGTVFDLMRARFQLLIKNTKTNKGKIKDLFWSLLIFGEMPEKFVNYIDSFNMKVLNHCIELGFIKRSVNDTLVFEHQLIAKSILLILEEKTYNPRPSITKLGLSDSTAKNFLENIQSEKHKTALFAIEEKYGNISFEKFNDFLPKLSMESVTDLFIQYIVDLVNKLIRQHNTNVKPILKIDSLSLLIKNSQDRLGVQKTASLFENIIEYQVDNYKLNAPCSEQFIELLKYYFYELPPKKKDVFLGKIEKIGLELLSELTDKTKKDDLEVWILWAFGRNAMHQYKFEEAQIFFNKGVALAKSKKNMHRLAEIKVQLGFLFSYLEDKEQVEAHWQDACSNFNGINFYEKVLKCVYIGNVGLLKGEFAVSNAMRAELEKLYESKDSYDYLKSLTNDFISNSLILELVSHGDYSHGKIKEIVTVLERYRTLTLMYDMNAYLHAAYKSLVFYKYIVENFKNIIDNQTYKEYENFIHIVAEELLRNYNWDSKSFEFFYPIFKDIAYAVGNDKRWRDYFVKIIPIGRRSLFLSLCTRAEQKTEYAPVLRRGIFNDSDDKINLFHYTYRW
ncbi:MAG: ATP-binding protein [Clostridiales bacterium]|nr:ATP-binding protein [Clostridiales bacterium]